MVHADRQANMTKLIVGLRILQSRLKKALIVESSVIPVCIVMFNIQKLRILPHSVFVFRMIVTTDSCATPSPP